ncbi:MAG: cobalamin B12-binding domain-containing protein, partial [Anaerolineaceae bacterium]|nr:cobalamin B12-binding domain-containing protein [Anaerolineaceae bacterium]
METIKWLLARQQEDGLSISKAVNLWRSIEDKGRSPLDYSALEQLNDQLENGGAQEGEYLQNLCEQWLQACFLFDERRAEQSLTQAFALYPVEMVMIELIQKGLAHAGELWYQGEVTVQQEHFTTELAVRRINAMIAAAPAPIRTSSVIVGSSAGEPHSFPALLLTLLLRYRGWDVVYLGANVPLQRLNEVVTSVKPDLVVMTAMRLATAGTLLETANYLMEIDRPLAFGGRVFHTIPDLHRRIPGYYLGDSLPDGLSQIEALLSGPAPQILRDEKPEEFHQVIAQFRAHRPQIESQVLEAMFAKRDENIFPEYIRNANDFLAEDIIAGLKLGSMD